jgi:hypothetical protein
MDFTWIKRKQFFISPGFFITPGMIVASAHDQCSVYEGIHPAKLAPVAQNMSISLIYLTPFMTLHHEETLSNRLLLEW